MPSLMHLKVLLPFGGFADIADVTRIVAETLAGSFGLLPHRLDCVAALVPGILAFETKSGGEVFCAVDEGAMVKTGADVIVSVRRAIGGTNLGQLKDAVEKQFVDVSNGERDQRQVIAKMETELLRRMAELNHG